MTRAKESLTMQYLLAMRSVLSFDFAAKVTREMDN